MKKLIPAAFSGILAAAVVGASAPAAAQEAYWMGPYFGGHVGYGGSNHGGDDRRDDAVSYTAQGLAVGWHAGYNWQGGQYVYGIEADGTIAPWYGFDLSGSGDNKSWETWVRWLASIRGRFGVAFNPDALLYVTGGVAFLGANHEVNIGDSKRGTGIFDKMGYVVGGGVEWMQSPNLSFRLEGLYYGFNKENTITFDGKDSHQSIGHAAVLRVGVTRHLPPN